MLTGEATVATLFQRIKKEEGVVGAVLLKKPQFLRAKKNPQPPRLGIFITTKTNVYIIVRHYWVKKIISV